LAEYAARNIEFIRDKDDCHFISNHVMRIVAGRIDVCYGRVMIANLAPAWFTQDNITIPEIENRITCQE